MIDQNIPVAEYVRRRTAILRGLKGAVGIVLASDGAPPLLGRWEPDPSFYYLTGLHDEPGGVVLFDPKNPDPTRQCVLLLKPRNPELEVWDGYRDSIGGALRAQLGFERVMRLPALPFMLGHAAMRAKRVACLHPLALHTAPVSPDFVLLRKLAERIPGLAIEDRSDLLPALRAVKSRAELKLMRAAIGATAAGYDELIAVLEPGVNEGDLQRALERGFVTNGATGVAYNPIVGSGLNSTIAHYMANDKVIEDGEVVCVDAGARFGGYAADITRTYPANGRFTKRQRQIYDTVLRAQEAAIRAVKPGVAMHTVDQAARDIITRAGFGDAYFHGVGHQLGLEVHDIDPGGTLKPGMVVTIEPGIYLPDEKIGVRIEDDILVTAKGHTNLSKMIPKTADEIEAQMRRAKRKRT